MHTAEQTASRNHPAANRSRPFAGLRRLCLAAALALFCAAVPTQPARAQADSAAQSAPATQPATQSGQTASLRIGPDGGYMKNRGGTRVLVFVHGFSDDSDAEWRCDDTHNWPAMIAADPNPAFANTDVYILGYQPPPRRGKTAVADLETAVVERMESAGVFRHREVIFVAHSMGGLLIQQVLEVNADKDWTKKVRGVFLYGTPQGSNKLSGLDRFIASDPRQKQLDSVGNNFLLHPANPRWSGIPHLCAYETLSDDGFSSVDYNGATHGCSDLLAIHANRANIVKPCVASDAAYTFLEDKLLALVPQSQ
jgi:pimeloyl-ACP methyl ester carboxylesterase